METPSRDRRLNVRVDPVTHERVIKAANDRFHGSEAMLMREALIVYLDLRDALGFDFDKTIQPLRERELAVPV